MRAKKRGLLAQEGAAISKRNSWPREVGSVGIAAGAAHTSSWVHQERLSRGGEGWARIGPVSEGGRRVGYGCYASDWGVKNEEWLIECAKTKGRKGGA